MEVGPGQMTDYTQVMEQMNGLDYSVSFDLDYLEDERVFVQDVTGGSTFGILLFSERTAEF